MRNVNVNREEIEESLKRSKNGKFSVKRAASALLAGLIISGSAIGLSGCNTKDNQSKYPDYVPGYSSVSAVKDNTDDSFVILDVGNHSRQRKISEIKKGNEKDISLGLVISTDADSEVAIYDDVEYVRSLINNYDVNFPVYLNIEGIINNKSLNNEMKGKLISDFLGKCSANHIFVGVYGSDSTLCTASKYFDFKDYDAFVVMDSDSIKYTGACTVFQTTDGEIFSKEDLSKTIQENGLNEADALVNDKRSFVKGSDELLQLSLECGLSYDELLEYNGLKEKDLEEGCEVKIPSRVGASVKTLTDDSLDDEMIMGCDISYCQGNVDWNKAKENFDFVIVRVSQGISLDESFTSHIENANKNGVAAGIYCFNNYNAKSCENLERFVELEKNQADFVVSSLQNHKIDYPVYLDIERWRENEFGVSWNELLPKDYTVSMINTWCSKIDNAGYIPGLYFSEDCYNYLTSVCDSIKNSASKSEEEAKFVDNFEKTRKWLAGGEQYGNTSYDISEVKEPSEDRKREFNDVDVFQVTSTATNSGAGNWHGHVDVNFSSTDYSKASTGDGDAVENVDIKEFDKKEEIQGKLVGMLPTAGVFLSGAALGTYLDRRHLKKERQRREERRARREARDNDQRRGSY